MTGPISGSTGPGRMPGRAAGSAPRLGLDTGLVPPPAVARPRPPQEPFGTLLGRLSRQSVTKHADAYADVDWDAESMQIDPADPRWELDCDDPLGATAWYRGRPAPVRARLGLHLIASQLKLGVQFENVLQRGLLELAATLPNGAPEFRYAYHEVIEEAQHSLMFQEFVNRTRLDVPGLGWLDRLGARGAVRTARTFPALFFFFVLGGEEPIDHAQREALRRGRIAHPLLRRLVQIHVLEEARHLSFARAWLRRYVPRLSRARRAWLALRAPVIFAVMTQQMMRPPAGAVRTYGIPRAVLAEAYGGERHRAATLAQLASVRALCWELGLVGPRTAVFWRRLGIWPAARDRPPEGAPANAAA